MTQRYRDERSRARMSEGLCPECGLIPDDHADGPFWMPRANDCPLLPRGVRDRIVLFWTEQFWPDTEGQ